MSCPYSQILLYLVSHYIAAAVLDNLVPTYWYRMYKYRVPEQVIEVIVSPSMYL